MIRILAVCAALTLAAPLAAQQAMPDDMAERMAEARSSEETARILLEMQQASAAAQQQFMGMTGAEFADGYRGAVAFPGEELGVWNVVLVSAIGEGADASLVALAEYEVGQGEILAETLHEPGSYPALTGTALEMARAKYVAPRAVIAATGTSYCIEGMPASEDATRSVSYIPLVLPPDESGAMQVYVLNGPIAEGSVPLGKHYRVRFDEFGQVGEPELLTDTCEVINWDPADPELSTSVYVTEFPEGRAPSVIHTFLSAQVPMNMGVVTGGIIWPMASGMIAPPVPVTDAGF